MKERLRNRLSRFTIIAVAVSILTVAMAFMITIIRMISYYSTGSRLMNDYADNFEDTIYIYAQKEAENYEHVAQAYHNELKLIEDALIYDDVFNFTEEEMRAYCPRFAEIRIMSDSARLYITDREGNLCVASAEKYIGDNLIEMGAISKEAFDILIYQSDYLDAMDTPMVKNKEKDILYVGHRVVSEKVDGKDYYIILGVDGSQVYDDSGVALSVKPVLESANSYSEDMHASIITNGKITSSSDASLLEGWNGDEFLEAINYQNNQEVEEYKTVNGTPYIILIRNVEIRGTECALMIHVGMDLDNREFLSEVLISSGLVLILFVFSAALYIVTCIMLRHSASTPGEYFKSILVSLVAVTIGFGALSYFPVTLSYLDSTISSTEVMDNFLEESYTNLEVKKKKALTFYRTMELTSADLAKYLMEQQGHLIQNGPEERTYYLSDKEGKPTAERDLYNNELTAMPNSSVLTEIRFLNGADTLLLLNDTGRAIASGSDDWYYNMSQDTAYGEIVKSVLYRQKSSYADYIKDGNGNNVGFITIYPVDLFCASEDGRTIYVDKKTYEEQPDRYDKVMGVLVMKKENTGTLESNVEDNNDIMMKMIMDNYCVGFAAISDNGSAPTVVYSEKDEGALNEFTIPEGMKGTNYNMFARIANVKRFVHISHYFKNNIYAVYAFDFNDIYMGRTTCVFRFMLAEALCLLVLGLIFFRWMHSDLKMIQKAEEDNESTEEGIDSKQSVYQNMLRNAGQRMPKTKRARWRSLVQITILIFVLIFVWFARNSDDMNLANIFSDEWERGFTFYNVLASIFVLIAVRIAYDILAAFLKVISKPLGRKVETYSSLFASAVQYILMFAGIFYSAHLLGMEMKSVTTVATVIVGVVGIGAQQLVQDIASGFFILAEGRLSVGDHVIADRNEGVIKEIGIRNTTIVTADHKICTVSNGNLRNVVLVPRADGSEEKTVKPEEPKQNA